MQNADYTYFEQGRRLITLVALCLSTAMLAVAVAYGVELFYLAPVFIALLMLLWMVIVNRRTGMALTGDQLMIFVGNRQQVVATADIRSVKFVNWMEGAPTITMRMANGPDVDIPGYCFGSAAELKRALVARKISIIES
jgi:hypothetical protein